MVTESDRQIVRDAVRNNDPLAVLSVLGLPSHKHLRRSAVFAHGDEPLGRAPYLDVMIRVAGRRNHWWHLVEMSISAVESIAYGLRHASRIYCYNAVEALFALCAFLQCISTGMARSCRECNHFVARPRKCPLNPGIKWSAGQEAKTVHADCPLVQIRGQK